MDIKKILEENFEPFTCKELVELSDEKEKNVQKELNRLIESGEVKKISTDGTDYYWLADEGLSVDEYSCAKTIFISWMVPVKHNNRQITDRMERFENRLEKIYADFIAIMGVFIAIFAIIFTNMSVVFEAFRERFDCDTWRAVILTEILTVIVIGFMLMFIKCFLKRK